MARSRYVSIFALMAVVASVVLTSGAFGNDHAKRVVLDEGARPGFRWGLVAYRDKGVEGGKRPCILTIIYFKSAWGVSESDDTICGSLPPGGPPEVRSYSFGHGEDEVTIFAVAFERRVQTIQLDLGAAGEKRTHLQIVNSRQKRIAKIRPFRFQTFSIHGPFCLGMIVGFDSDGDEIYSSTPEECSSAES